jgi:membrane-associated phospholipid phosphatase
VNSDVTLGVLRPKAIKYRRRGSDAVAAAAGGAAFGVATAVASVYRLTRTEVDVFNAINELPSVVHAPLWVVTQSGSFPAVFVTAGLALLARRPRLALALAGGGTAAWMLAKVVKNLVDRGRPEALLHHVIVYGAPATGLGYPSGHSAVAACLMTVAAPYLTRPARIAGWTLVVLVGVARVFVGAHFPLDVLGGWAFGLAVGSLTNLVVGTPDASTA